MSWKIIFSILVFLFVVCSALSLCTGCKSNGNGTDIGQPIIEHTIEVERSQAIQRELVATIDRGAERLDNIRKSAELLSGNIGEIIALFAEYDRAVWQLISELKSVADGTGNRAGKSPAEE